MEGAWAPTAARKQTETERPKSSPVLPPGLAPWGLLSLAGLPRLRPGPAGWAGEPIQAIALVGFSVL